MKVYSLRNVACLVAAGMFAGGCHLLSRAPKDGSPGKPGGPIQYTPARDGLPTSKIWKSQIAFGDINGDGFADIGAVSRLADGPHVWTGNGRGQWSEASSGLPRESFCGGGVDFGDVNNDGKMDVAIADHCRGVFVFAGDGAGNWKNSSAGLPTVGSEDVTVGDFNRDSCLDLAVVAASEEGVRVFSGNCKGVWKESSKGLPHTEWGNSIVAGDMDADGDLDLVAAYSAGPRMWLNDGKGNWTEASEGLPAPEIHGLYWGAAVGDVNGDGKLDIATGAAIPGTEVFIQEPGPKWRNASQGIIPMNGLGVALGDLNKDGHVDLVAVGKANLDEIGGVYGVFPFLGDGKGNWTLVDNTGLPATGRERTWGVGLADINNDGVLDIGVAFGDVLSPTWRSGPGPRNIETQPQDTPKDDKKDEGKDKKVPPPERGMFGAIEVWRGQLTAK